MNHATVAWLRRAAGAGAAGRRTESGGGVIDGVMHAAALSLSMLRPAIHNQPSRPDQRT